MTQSLAICVLLYCFLLGLEILGSSAKILRACSTTGQLLQGNTKTETLIMIALLAAVVVLRFFCSFTPRWVFLATEKDRAARAARLIDGS